MARFVPGAQIARRNAETPLRAMDDCAAASSSAWLRTRNRVTISLEQDATTRMHTRTSRRSPSELHCLIRHEDLNRDLATTLQTVRSDWLNEQHETYAGSRRLLCPRDISHENAKRRD